MEKKKSGNNQEELDKEQVTIETEVVQQTSKEAENAAEQNEILPTHKSGLISQEVAAVSIVSTPTEARDTDSSAWTVVGKHGLSHSPG